MSQQDDAQRLMAELELRKVTGPKPDHGDWIESLDTATGEQSWYPAGWYNELRVAELRQRNIEPPLSLALQAAQHRLARDYEAQQPKLLPDEDRAYLSMIGKLQTMQDFLQSNHPAPATGPGSLAAAIALSRSMVADIHRFIDADACKPFDAESHHPTHFKKGVNHGYA
jgi:hypothetical protein